MSTHEKHSKVRKSISGSPGPASKISNGILIWIGLALAFTFLSLHNSAISTALRTGEFDADLLFASPTSQRQLTPYRFYHELHDEIHTRASSVNEFGHHRRQSTTAYNEATVVHHSKWFHSRKQCRKSAGCCVETFAVSLEQDDTKIVNTGDGKDLADLMLEFDRRPGQKYLRYYAQPLQPEMMPCLVSGTTIFLENNDKTIQYFFNTMRPKIIVPYALVLSGTDSNSPGRMYMKYVLNDPLLIKLYGTNPNITATQMEYGKYQAIPTGLSRSYPQEKHMSQYLELTQYQNPFANKERWDLSSNPLQFDQDVFVHFGLRLPHRQRLWDSICNSTTTETQGTELSCHQETAKHTVNDIYASMSKHRFGISPPGKGWDCYRTYELLLLGIIPIVDDRSHIGSNQLLEGLPVIQMSMYHDAYDKKKPKSKQDFIEAIEDYIASDEFQNTNFEEGWQKLFLRHSRRKLLKDTRRDKEIVRDANGKEYYTGYKYSVIDPPLPKETFCIDKEKCLIPGNKVDDSWLVSPPKVDGKDKDFVNLIEVHWKKQPQVYPDPTGQESPAGLYQFGAFKA